MCPVSSHPAAFPATVRDRLCRSPPIRKHGPGRLLSKSKCCLAPCRPGAQLKVTARLPGGEVLPLLWLYQFDGASKRTFTFRSPLDLPVGTVIESSYPLRFVLQTHRESDLK